MSQIAKKISRVLFLTGGIFWVSSCQLFNTSGSEEETKPVVARVYDRYLYKEDVEGLMPNDLTEADSLAFLQNYINVWAKDQLMILKAEYNLTESQKNFEKQIEEYRNDLLKFAYRQQYISQTLDTNISANAIKSSYKGGSNDFVLKENILRVDYAAINLEAPNLEKAIKWFYSKKEKDESSFYDYALKYSYKFSVRDSTWISYEQLRKQIPLPSEDVEGFIKSTGFTQFKDSTNVYLLEIKDYRLRGDKAPLPYSREIIKNILINKRKLDIVNSLEQNLLEDALDKKEFEVY